MQSVISRIAQSDSPVLILGEHGVGKRSVAEQIHAHSNRSSRSFQEIQAAEVSAANLSAALSNHGTVYLAEVGEIGHLLQDLMISAYQQGRMRCRLLCGSSRDLLDRVRAGQLREDLLYLISTVALRVPPLRYRHSEILVIADELLTFYSQKFERPKPTLCDEMIGHLTEHTWPENLPELQTAIKTIIAIGDQAVSLAAIRAASPSRRRSSTPQNLRLKEATKASSIQIERQLISEVLGLTSGNRRRAAIELGISYKALLYKLKRIQAEDQQKPGKEGVA
jgi:DNA-binding NtrC family response regulator